MSVREFLYLRHKARAESVAIAAQLGCKIGEEGALLMGEPLFTPRVSFLPPSTLPFLAEFTPISNRHLGSRVKETWLTGGVWGEEGLFLEALFHRQ